MESRHIPILDYKMFESLKSESLIDSHRRKKKAVRPAPVLKILPMHHMHVIPAFHTDCWLGGLSRYSPINIMERIPLIISQTISPHEPSLFINGPIIPLVWQIPTLRYFNYISKYVYVVCLAFVLLALLCSGTWRWPG